MKSWLEGGPREDQASCVLHVGGAWVLERSHRTLGRGTQTRQGDKRLQAVSMHVDSEGEGEGWLVQTCTVQPVQNLC